ncbi:MAG: flagellar hook-length control protein FliK [Vicinamibacterales bacterium]
MIGISRGIGPLGLPVAPAGTPPAAPVAGGAAPGAFDAAFAELTSALLATAAGAVAPAAGKGGAAVGDAPIDTHAASTAGDDTTANAAVAVPVAVPLPTPIAFVPVAPATGAGDTPTDAAIDAAGALMREGGAAPRQASAASIATGDVTAAGVASDATSNATSNKRTSRLAAFQDTMPPTGATGAAISSEILGGDDVRDQWVDETLIHETRGDDTGDAGPVHGAVDPILPSGLRRQATPLPSQTTDGSALAAPTPAPAKTSAASAVPAPALSAGLTDTAMAENASPQTDDVAATLPPVAETAAAETAAATAPPVTSGLALRAEALQRALGRRHEAEHGETSPAGLTTQAARVEAAVAPQTTGNSAGRGASDGENGDAAAHSRRGVRMASGATPATIPATVAAANTAPGHVTKDGAAPAPATSSWRAAVMAARFAEPASAPVEGPRPAGVPPAAAFAASVVAAEPTLPRESRPVMLETVAHVPQDTATADHVQMQIVKSMKLQWTGATQEARVQLKPEYLGEVVANIKVEQGVVTATLHADTPEVRRMLETQTASLRDALVEHGLKLDKVVIAEPETPSGQQGDRRSRGRQPQPESPRPKPRRARADGDGATFELSTE